MTSTVNRSPMTDVAAASSSSSSFADVQMSTNDADVKTNDTAVVVKKRGRKRRTPLVAATKNKRQPVCAVDRLLATALVTSEWPCIGDEEGEAVEVEKDPAGKPIVFFKVKWEKGRPSWEPASNILGDELIPQFNKDSWFDPQWFYHTKESGWVEYSKEDAAATEAEYVTWKIAFDGAADVAKEAKKNPTVTVPFIIPYTPKELKLGVEGYTYRLDFEKFTQTNTNPRYLTVRNLQRRVTAA